MSGSGIYFSTFKSLFQWASANSLWYFATDNSCCANEILQTAGCRYDLERFGCVPQVDPKHADLLIVFGVITQKAQPELKKLYDSMSEPKYVLAVGACACTGGPYSPDRSYSTTGGAAETVPVDVYVPGCPPRPEAIMKGLLQLKDKIREQ